MIRSMIRSAIERAAGIVEANNENLKWAAEFVTSRSVEGDYFEFGVYEGNSMGYAYRRLEASRAALREHHRRSGLALPAALVPELRYFAFDSFQGLPEPSGADAGEHLPNHWQAGSYKCSVDDFKRNLARKAVDLSRVVCIEGWYDQTLTPHTKSAHGMRKGSIFHIDCDFYESSILALEFITDLYVDGSILIFDDWFGFKGNPRYGEQRAFSEWSEKHGIASSEFWRYQARSVAFVLHKN